MLPIMPCSRRAPNRFCSAMALTRNPRLFTSANSAATKNALAASRRTASSRLTETEFMFASRQPRSCAAIPPQYSQTTQPSFRQLPFKEGTHQRGLDIVCDHRAADGFQQDEG